MANKNAQAFGTDVLVLLIPKENVFLETLNKNMRIFRQPNLPFTSSTVLFFL